MFEPGRTRPTPWTEISTDFDPEEETANFGTRHALEADGSIYEVVTLSTIEPCSPVDCKPSILSESNNYVVLAVDSTLIIFSKDCQDAESLVFNSKITCLALSSCANFIVLGLEEGRMEFLHVATRKVLTSIPILDTQTGNRFYSAALLGPGNNSKIFLIMTGLVVSFENLNLDFLHSAIMTGDLNSLKSAQSSFVKCEYSSPLDIDGALVYMDSLYSTSILVSSTDGLARLEIQDEEMIISEELESEGFGGGTLIKLICGKDRRRLYLLDNLGQVHIICAFTLTVLRSFKDVIVTELVLLEEENSSELQFLLVTQDSSGSYLELRNSKTYQVNYRLQVSEFCVPLVADISQDTPMMLEGTADNVLAPENITKLRLRGITEGIPQVRLERILRRGRFDEAEKFAETFGLNKDCIYRGKVSWLLERLSPWNTSTDAETKKKLFLDAKECLSNLQDMEFVIECCSLAALPSIEMTRELLEFARRRIGTCSEDKQLNTRHLLSIGETMHRLETFVITEEDRSVESWMKFSRVDILSEIKKTLTRGNVNTALLYWVRHQAELRSRMDLPQILEILSSLPVNISIQSQLLWLRQFIPDVLQRLPDSLPSLAAWACDSVEELEGNQRDWPENGLCFAKDVLATMQFEKSDDFNQFLTILTLNQQRSEEHSALSKLIHLINLLKDLLQLKTEFRIKIKLSEFSVENKFSVVSSILDWVMLPEDIPNLMNEFLTQFILKFKMNVNQTLMEYAMNLLHNTNFTWHWHVGAAPWEEKVSQLLPFLTSVEEKSNVILEAVKQAPVPWSKTIFDICEIGCALEHPNSMQIKEQSSLVSVKGIFRKYDCRNYMMTGRDAERLFLYILVKGGEEGFKDILEVCKVMGTKSPSDVKKMYIEHLVENQIDPLKAFRIVQDIMEVSQADGVLVCEEIVNRAGICFKLEIGGEVETAYSLLLHSIVSTYSSRVKNAQLQVSITTAGFLLNALNLKNEFGLNTAETDFSNKSGSIRDINTNKDLLFKYIEDLVPTDPGSKDRVVETQSPEQDLSHELNRILRICDLTGLSHEDGIGRYILLLNKRGLYKESLKVADILQRSSLNPTLANILYSVVYNTEGVASQGGEVGTLPDTLSSLCSSSLVYCQDSALIDTLELYSWQSISSRIHAESHDRRAYSSASTTSLDVYQEWKFSHVFKDKGLPLDGEELLPYCYQGLECVLPLVENPPLQYLPRSNQTTVEVCDLNVTAPDLESIGNGVDARAVCLDLVSSGNCLVSSLQTAGHAQLGFQVLERVESVLDSLLLGTDPEFQGQVQVKCSQIKVNLVSQLAQRILSDSNPEPKLCLGLLNILEPKTVLSLLSKIYLGFGQDYRRISSLAAVGYQFCKLFNLSKQGDQFLELFIKSSWGKQSSALEVPFKTAFSGSVKEKVEALELMVLRPGATVDLLLQYSRAFKIPPNQTLILYTSTLFRKMEAKVGEDGELEKENISEIRDKLKKGLSLFSPKEAVYQYLVQEFSKVSPYNYEALEFILEEIHQHRMSGTPAPEFTERASRILGFLLQYKRISAPQPEAEIDPWIKETGTSFPRIALRRLPLYSLIVLPNKEKCKLLEKEFSLETYRSWKLVSDSLGVSVDTICMFTVTNTVSSILDRSNKINQGAQDQWSIDFNNRSALENLMNCILEMKNPEKAAAASCWIVNRLPRGADKVLAAHGYLRMAEAWLEKDSTNQESRAGLDIAQKMVEQLETEQILYLHNLAVNPYLELVEQNKPVQLISALYEDESIISRNRVASGDYPDIAGAVKEIVRINHLNYSQMKYDLLDRWLPLSSASQANQTISDFTLETREDLDTEEQDGIHLLRCIYILQDGAEDGIRYLLKSAVSDDPLVSTNHRLRALKCLFSIASSSELEEYTGRTAADLRTYLKNLIFISRMENLNLPFNLQAFQEYNKSSLVEGIWRTCKHSVEGVVLVRDLCYEFSIWDINLWSALLTQINKFNIFKELEKTLVLLSSQPQIWSSQQFISSWNSLLLSPFISLISPVSVEDEGRVRHILRLVHACPTAGDLELERVAEECLRTDLAHLAIILLPYLPEVDGLRLRERILNQVSQVELTSKLDELTRLGFPLPQGISNTWRTSPAL